ncbi:hypothetical protein [uncultured Treponema sp.]|uniref:hypothetical protein n=1 Tax=uncultured Treponema sp. TaxID=162155 RepID=UPI0025D3CFA1|nr:hypothetical protein [uncultured Treponema sp.]
MDEKININIEEKDEKEFFITIHKGEKNLISDLELCQYRDEMEYWGYPLKLFKSGDKSGYICSKEYAKDDLLLETERILKKYKLME